MAKNAGYRDKNTKKSLFIQLFHLLFYVLVIWKFHLSINDLLEEKRS